MLATLISALETYKSTLKTELNRAGHEARKAHCYNDGSSEWIELRRAHLAAKEELVRLRSLQTKFGAIAEVKATMARLGVTTADLAGIA